jgi:RNA-directed DNA polymerase
MTSPNKGGGTLAQKLTYPNTEGELQAELDRVFKITQETVNKNDVPRWKGIYEVVSSETAILTAIHKIKANKGSKTAGSDGKVISDYLQRDYGEIITEIQQMMNHYNPAPIRRKFIPKPGKDEMRPLGIPTVKDRIIQECVRMVIEPILEAQFFERSYGFRPMRSTEHAFSRVSNLIF